MALGPGAVQRCGPRRPARDGTAAFPPGRLYPGRWLQSGVGTIRGARPTMVISLCGLTAPELPADLCLSGHGRRALWDSLPGSGTPAGTWLVTGGRRAAR